MSKPITENGPNLLEKFIDEANSRENGLYRLKVDGDVVVRGLHFKCSHCEQQYNGFSLDLAIWLYGVFFLTSKEKSYFGFNCPSCLHTQLMGPFSKDFDSVVANLLQPSSTDYKVEKFPIRYFSSVNYAPERIEKLEEFNIITSTFSLYKGMDAGTAWGMVCQQTEGLPHLDNEYLCSYLPLDDPPMGEKMSVSWFHSDEIQGLCQFENDHGRKVFPRYYHYSQIFDEIEKFTWEYYLSGKYLSDGLAQAGNDRLRLESLAYKEGIDIGHLHFGEHTEPDQMSVKETFEANKLIIESILEKRNDEAKWDIPAIFMKILEADPDPFLFPPEFSELLKGIWKTTLPFRKNVIPDSLKKIDLERFNQVKNVDSHGMMIREIQQYFHLKTIQEVIKKNYIGFIEDYIGCAENSTFSYADLWALKERYLKRIFTALKEKGHTEKDIEYAFILRGGVYEIIYDGKEPYLAKRCKGMKFYHYLVQHKNENINIFDLDKIDGIDPEHIQAPKVASSTDHAGYQQNRKKNSSSETYTRNRSPQEIKKAFEYRLKELKENLLIAKMNGDIETSEGVQQKINEFKKTKMDLYKTNGKERPGRDKNYKQVKDRIVNAINRAINSIENPELKKHFEKSLKKRGPDLAYYPEPDLGWITE